LSFVLRCFAAIELHDTTIMEELFASQGAMGNSSKTSETSDGAAAAAARTTRQRMMSDAQREHIVQVRGLVERGVSDQLFTDWRNFLIKPRIYGKQNTPVHPSAFHIKPSAIWVPHLIMKQGARQYHPYCPYCSKPVPIIDYFWVDTPMIVYGTNTHRFLDTVRYRCQLCIKTFRATDQRSMALDKTGNCRATFGIYLLPRCAVDEDLYHFITGSILEPTANIVAKLQRLSMQKYVSSMNEYYLLALQHRSSSSSSAAPGGSIDAFVQRGIRAETSTIRNLKSKLSSAERSYSSKKRSAEGPIPFEDIDGIGTSKRQRLQEIGINNGRDILNANESKEGAAYTRLLGVFTKSRNPVGVVTSYATKVTARIQALSRIAEEGKNSLQQLQNKLISLETAGDDSTAAETVVLDDGAVGTEAGADEVPPIAPFSKSFDSPREYNGKFVSTHNVESVVHSYFQHQKPGMMHRMTNLGGEIISIDTVYGPATRIAVYINRKPFRPFKALTTIMNEHGQVIS
jgi:transposase-like protein